MHIKDSLDFMASMVLTGVGSLLFHQKYLGGYLHNPAIILLPGLAKVPIHLN